MNNNISKINTFGKVGYIICKIGKICTLIGAVACLVGAVLMFFVPKDAVKIELSSVGRAVVYFDENTDMSKLFETTMEEGILKIGPNSYSITTEDDGSFVKPATIYVSNLKWFLLAVMLTCVSAYIPFRFGCKLCAHFKSCTTPFTEDIARGLTNLAWSLIPVSVLGMIVPQLTESLLLGDIDIVFGVDIATVLLILCVFMLSYIFRYGAALQTESDETL